MHSIHLKSIIVSAFIIYVLAITAFVISYLFPVMQDPNQQANWVLSIALVPAVVLGAHIYYRKGHKTNGFILGILMLSIAILLDVVITVPLFIMPYGGDYISFFTDLAFWLIALEYVSIVVAYWKIERAIQNKNK